MRSTLAVAAMWTWIAWAAAPPAPAAAGAWAQPAGGYYAKASGIRYGAEEVYNDMGRRAGMGMDGERFDSVQSFLYVEYGLRPRLTLVSQFGAGRLTSENRMVRRERTATGDLEVWLKYQTLDDPVVVSPMVGVKAPIGYEEGGDPPVGTGDFDAEARLLLARSLYPLPAYVGLEAGYRLRRGPFSNQVSWSGEVGATPRSWLFVKLLAGGTDTRTSGAGEDLGVVGASTQVSEGDFTKVGGNVAVRLIEGVWLDLLHERTVAGENIGAGSSWGLGLSVGG